jgi:CubicO group peptidase (beta-lactamase class C family)
MTRRIVAWLSGVCVAAGLASCASAPPAPQPVERGDIAGVQQQLQALIAHERTAGRIAGMSIALVDDQRVVWRYGAGFADAERQVPATADTLYRMGSISKVFTDTAAMQLVAEGRLALDEPVSRILPWWEIGGERPEEPVTLRRLMTHHAGIPRDFAAGMWLRTAPGPQGDFRTMLRGLRDESLDAPPGLVFGYSNVGLDLVGALVEAAADQPFEQRVQAHVLAPLGMREASFSAALPASAHMARGHLKGEPQTEPALRDTPAGGLTASVEDIARFIEMQFANGRNAEGQAVLPAAELAEMLRVQNADVPLDGDMLVGLGWLFTTFGLDTVKGGGPVAHHAGATLYFRTQLMMLPDQKLGVIVASNDGAAGKAVSRVAQRALALLLEARTGRRQPPPEPGFREAAQPWPAVQRQAIQQACTGDWMTIAGPAVLRAEGDRMSAEMEGKTLVLREGEGGRLGLAYRLLGLMAVDLGPLGQMGLSCRDLAGRHLLLAELDGKTLVVGERLPAEPDTWPFDIRRFIGRYRAQLASDELPTLADGNEVRIEFGGGRLWARYRLHPAFGGIEVRALLRPVPGSEDSARIVGGPLADYGSIVKLDALQPGLPQRVRYSGWAFERVEP